MSTASFDHVHLIRARLQGRMTGDIFVVESYLRFAGMTVTWPYLIFVTGTKGSACLKNSVRCKIFQIECKKNHILHFLGLFVVICGCKILGFQNPANVKEITNMRYGCGLLLLWAPTWAAFCRPLLSVVDGGRGRASHWRKPQRGKEQQHLFQSKVLSRKK